jgi:hypothetical protein
MYVLFDKKKHTGYRIYLASLVKIYDIISNNNEEEKASSIYKRKKTDGHIFICLTICYVLAEWYYSIVRGKKKLLNIGWILYNKWASYLLKAMNSD